MAKPIASMKDGGIKYDDGTVVYKNNKKNPLKVKAVLENKDGTSTNVLSNGERSIVKYSQAHPPYAKGEVEAREIGTENNDGSIVYYNHHKNLPTKEAQTKKKNLQSIFNDINPLKLS